MSHILDPFDMYGDNEPLKDCPYCGGEPELNEDPQRDCTSIDCSDCFARIIFFYQEQESAEDRIWALKHSWNRRTYEGYTREEIGNAQDNKRLREKIEELEHKLQFEKKVAEARFVYANELKARIGALEEDLSIALQDVSRFERNGPLAKMWELIADGLAETIGDLQVSAFLHTEGDPLKALWNLQQYNEAKRAQEEEKKEQGTYRWADVTEEEDDT